MKNSGVNSTLIFLLITFLFFTFFSHQSSAQECIPPIDAKNNMGNPWPVPEFNYVNGSGYWISRAGGDAREWLEHEFSIDMWVRYVWPVGVTNLSSVIFNAGGFPVENKSLTMMITIPDGGGAYLNVTDGYDLLNDITYNILDEFFDVWDQHWVHIALTYNEYQLTLYVNGENVDDMPFDFEKIDPDFFQVGCIPTWNASFIGNISGFRLWKDRALDDDEVAYIKDRSFYDKSSFSDEYDTLYHNLLVNLNTTSGGVTSLPGGYDPVNNQVIVSNFGYAYINNSRYHPTPPFPAGNVEIQRECSSIRLDWDDPTKDVTGHTVVHYVYRKLENASGDPELLCITKDAFYLDDDPGLLPGQEYVYTIETKWLNPSNGSVYTAHLPDPVITAVKTLPATEDITIVEDASTNRCDGGVKIIWEDVPHATAYDVYYQVNSGDSLLIEEISAPEQSYTHNVDPSYYGDTLRYFIEAKGDDGCLLMSPPSSPATANTECKTKPFNVLATVEGDNIKLTWDFVQSGAPATKFEIQRKTGSGGFETIAIINSADVREYYDPGDMCMGYTYRVMADNECGATSEAISDPSLEVTIPGQFDNIFEHPEAFFDASKGYFNTKVILEWAVNPDMKSKIKAFEIWRKGLDSDAYTLISTLDNQNATYYEDKAVEANAMFQYMIRATGECYGENIFSDSLSNIGFRTNTGIISGKVTYAGGNAVEEVEVRVKSSSPTRAMSIDFDGMDDKLISAKNLLEMGSLHTSPVSAECWIKPSSMSSGERNYIITNSGHSVFLCLKNYQPFAGIDISGGPTEFMDPNLTLDEGTWYHLALNLDTAGRMYLYLDGMVIDSVHFVPISTWSAQDDSLYVGGGSNTFFSGQIDEVRIWNTFRSHEDVRRDHIRLLAGNETGLQAYWRLNEGVGDFAYDISRTGDVFHKNDIHNGSGTPLTWSDQTPSFEQLHPSGITDVKGNYLINGIMYSGSGNIFSATPILGIHHFNPTDLNLFIGDNSPVHNNVNFLDESSFRFTGSVKYRNTDFPVKGASVYVDNMQVFDEGGHPVLTNDDGWFDIQVPIGDHYISLKKDRHVFANNGQWPPPTEFDPYRKFYFQEDVYEIGFIDSTTVIVAGRFVGGDREGNKVLGFDKSINNIGTGTVTLKNDAGFDIDLRDGDNWSPEIQFITRNASGEYQVHMLPEQYNILSVESPAYTMDQDDLGVLDLSNIPALTMVSDTSFKMIIQENGDTIWEVDSVYTYAYHFKRNFIYYEQPSIEVKGADGEAFWGEKEIILLNEETEENDTIDLTPAVSPFLYPVFSMGKTYDIDIRVYEIYYNDTVEDVVPVEDAEVTITNNLDMHTVTSIHNTDEFGAVNGYRNFRVGMPNMNRDIPNLASYTKTMTIIARTRKHDVSWNDGNVFRSYILGAADAGGANFVTYGPETPDFILRDPPGSNSYTYLKQGSEFSVSRSFSIDNSSNSSLEMRVALGAEFEVGGGLAGPVFKTKTKADFGGGMETTSSVSKNGEFTETYKFTKEYRTSSDPNAVGSMADVYIGKSTNMYFTETRNLSILPNAFCSDKGLEQLDESELADTAVGYTLGIRPGFAANPDESATAFIYTQDHILNNLIPQYRILTFNLLANNPNYESMVSAEHPFYAMSNMAGVWRDSTTWVADSLHPSYKFYGDPTEEIDSIAFLNQQISIWLQTIAMNEASKVSCNNILENISFDGNAGAYTNEVSYTEADADRKQYSFTWDLFYSSKAGFEIMGVGTTTSSKSSKSFGKKVTEEDEVVHEISWGYVLDDGDQDDYYSIDVCQDDLETMEYYTSDFLNENNFEDRGRNLENIYDNAGITGGIMGGISAAISEAMNPLAGFVTSVFTTAVQGASFISTMNHYQDQIRAEGAEFGLTGTSPMFRIRGGQSSCPYEGPEYTFFYSDPKTGEPYILHIGTQAHEEPAIDIEPSVIVNIPANKKAVFTLKLTNNSPTNKDLTYVLKIDEASNPGGARIRVDGLSPNRPFFIPAGTTMSKTLTVEKGPTSQMSFEDLRLILHSDCQYDPDDNFTDIADTVGFSVHFLPACTEVEFGNLLDNWVLNDSYDDTMSVEIKGYDINHDNLDKILFQYAKPGYTPVTAMSFYKNEDDFNAASEPKTWLEGNAEIDYKFPVGAMTDGIYELTLKSVCYDKSNYQTDKLTGVIDRILPKPFGAPQPSDGVISTGEEISILFNEKIDAGNLYVHKDYISVRGMLNGTDLTTQQELLHDVSLHFDGSGQNVTVPGGINLAGSPFTFEFWMKRSGSGEECILSQGDPDNGGLWIGFDGNDKFMMRIAGESMTTNNSYDNIAGKWCHLACGLSSGNDKGLYILVATADGNEENFKPISAEYAGSGPLVIGSGPDGKAFSGNLHHLRLWNVYRTIEEISAQRYMLLTGYEKGLMAYWPFDDASGVVAREPASGKNGMVSATWEVSRDNKSVELDGTGHVKFATGSMVFPDQVDFTIEFWFKAAAQDACLFSNGKGDGTDGYESNWTILCNTGGEISILNHGTQVLAPVSGYLDDRWHHFAMVLDRQSSLRLYMDGDLVSTSTVSGLTGFGSAQVVLGARWWYDEITTLDHFDKGLNGFMDEVRIWNSARMADLIRDNMHTALSGSESGLKAYFPFENVNVSDPSISVNTLENMTVETIGIAGACIFEAGSAHAGEAPTIKLPRPVINIPFNYIINEDRVIIQPNLDPSLVENQVLTISIRRVLDMHNNRMGSTVTWTAFMDVNSLVWENSEISLTKKPEEEMEFTTRILNKGGQKEYFVISNYPDWLEVSEDHGTIEPLGSKEIRFRLFAGLNPGQYTTNVYLSGNLEYNERLQLEVGVKAEPPAWEVMDGDFEFSMSIIGQLKINGVLSTDENDMVAAFRGKSCVGLANVEYIKDHDIYRVFLNLFSNDPEGESIHFKVWDSDKNRLHPEVTPVITFKADDLIGSASAPQVINALNLFSNSMAMTEGWNWVSFNLNTDKLSSLNSLFLDLSLQKDLELIKGPAIDNQSIVFSTFNGENWQGSLSEVTVSDMYKLKLSREQDFVFSGEPVVTGDVPIELEKGWNWIGYTPQVNLTVKEAFGYHTPSANDLVKGQYAFAIYDELMGWLGSLEYLQPGLGYMYNSAVAATYYYPEMGSLKSLSLEDAETPVPGFVKKYPTTMNLIARIIPEGTINEEYTVYAFRDKEATGMGLPVFNSKTGEWLWFIQVYGDSGGELIGFSMENAISSERRVIKEKFMFQKDGILGTLEDPVDLTLLSLDMDPHEIHIYPNPFSDELFVTVEEPGRFRFELTDLEGRIIWNAQETTSKSNQVIRLNLPSLLKEGFYILKTAGETGTTYTRIVKQ